MSHAPHSPSSHDHDHTHGHGHGHSHAPEPTGSHDQAEILDLDADVLAEHTDSITAWLPVTAAPRRILDLGCGTGAGTFALLARFPEARVTAVDASGAHLDRLRERARELGLADRVRTVRADLDGEWPDLAGPDAAGPDLFWASASLHHMADPGRTLRTVRGLLAPGGLLAVVELAGFPRFLPADAPRERPGLEDRCHAALESRHTEQLPHRGADWGPELAAAGFTVEGERTIAVHVDGAGNAAVGRYALSSLGRLRDGAAAALDARDLTALERLLDIGGPGSILRRDDLAVRTERTVWAARAGASVRRA
ncbi:class I SAM-dependent methyltransferase [Streptomyces sp. NPDC059917]|uniref:class I SAM-dependent methyltransferase n=1 Tax=Streptomyces sp. NPDC059917 TaxID=3347002 RepID=UPI00364B921B